MDLINNAEAKLIIKQDYFYFGLIQGKKKHGIGIIVH